MMRNIEENQAVALYCRAVSKRLSQPQQEKLFLVLQPDLEEYITRHPNATLEELELHFGTPEQFAATDTEVTDKLVKKRRSAIRYLLIALIILAATAVVVVVCALILNHHLAQPDIDLPWPPVSEVSKP